MFNVYRYYPDFADNDNGLSVFSNSSSNGDQVLEDAIVLVDFLQQLRVSFGDKQTFDSYNAVYHEWKSDTGCCVRVRLAKLYGIKHTIDCSLNLRRHRDAVLLIKLTYVCGDVHGVD